MERKLTAQDLVKAVHGDLEAFSFVQEQPPAAIQACRDSLPELVLPHNGIRKVLTELQRKHISPEQAQRWASFVRRGYIAGTQNGPVLPIDIDYEDSHEEQIAAAVARLDEIGDLIDGEISDDELQTMIHTELAENTLKNSASSVPPR